MNKAEKLGSSFESDFLINVFEFTLQKICVFAGDDILDFILNFNEVISFKNRELSQKDLEESPKKQ